LYSSATSLKRRRCWEFKKYKWSSTKFYETGVKNFDWL